MRYYRTPLGAIGILLLCGWLMLKYSPTFTLFDPSWVLYTATAIYGIAGLDYVLQWERRPVMFFGMYVWTAGPGIIWVPPLIFQVLADVSVQERVVGITVENARTKDNVPLSLTLALTHLVLKRKVRLFITTVEDGFESVKQRAEAAVVEVIGSQDYDGIQADRVSFSSHVRTSLQEKVDHWGVKIIGVEIKDIKITDQNINEAIAMVARATEVGRAEKIYAQTFVELSKKYDIPPWKIRELVMKTQATQGGGILMDIGSHDSEDFARGIGAALAKQHASQHRESSEPTTPPQES